MEFHWSHANSGKHGAAGEGFSIGDPRTITQILERDPEDDFECTYFRQRTNRPPIKTKKDGGVFPTSINYTLPSELSDGYTDSESESDNTSNVERWLESLPANDAWSSAPNYSALDGSEGLEGADEIQEDSKRSSENDTGTFPNSANDSKRNFESKVEDFEVKVTEGHPGKRTSARQDGSSVMVELLDRNEPRKKIQRTLKSRQKIEREARILIEKVKLLEGNGYGIPEKNISIDEEAASSKSNTLETTESRTAIKRSCVEEDGYDELMQEMVNRLLTVSAYREEKSTSEEIVEKSRKESFSRIDSVADFKKLCYGEESEETVNSSISKLEIRRVRLSATLKKYSPKVAKTKMKENELSKSKKERLKTETNRRKPKRIRKIPQGRKHQLKSVQKCRYSITSQPFSENMEPLEKKKKLRTVRFADEVNEAWRQTAIAKVARNKQILETVEQIVDGIQNEGLHHRNEDIRAEDCGLQKNSKNLISELESGDVIDSKKFGTWKNNRKRPMHSIENKTTGSRKPVFTNPFIEKCLDKAMDLALSKYKSPQNTWADFNEKKTRESMSSTAYEPPNKKRKPKLFTSKRENTKRQDFSLFNSWQSIHNYFMSYSSC